VVQPVSIAERQSALLGRKILAGDRSQVEIGRCFFQQGERDALIAHRSCGCASRPEPQLVEAGLQLGAEDEKEGGGLRQVLGFASCMPIERSCSQPAKTQVESV
jgi:hypothetical protein